MGSGGVRLRCGRDTARIRPGYDRDAPGRGSTPRPVITRHERDPLRVGAAREGPALAAPGLHQRGVERLRYRVLTGASARRNESLPFPAAIGFRHDPSLLAPAAVHTRLIQYPSMPHDTPDGTHRNLSRMNMTAGTTAPPGTATRCRNGAPPTEFPDTTPNRTPRRPEPNAPPTRTESATLPDRKAPPPEPKSAALPDRKAPRPGPESAAVPAGKRPRDRPESAPIPARKSPPSRAGGRPRPGPADAPGTRLRHPGRTRPLRAARRGPPSSP